MNKKLSLITTLLCGLATPEIIYAQQSVHPLEGPYLGQQVPGMTPEVFAPNVISTSMWETSGVFSPDMKAFYYIRGIKKDNKLEQQLVAYKHIDNKWISSVVSPRIGQPAFSPDGKTLHLGARHVNISVDGWSEIKRKSEDFTQYRIMSLSTSNYDTYVFDEATSDGKGVLRYSTLVNGLRTTPKPLPEVINTGEWNAHPFIAPDESYIIWDGQRNSDIRNADLFISFKDQNGNWSEAIKFGDEINTPASEAGGRVTPDGKYLFFNRTVGSFDWTHDDGQIETIPNVDVFWVDARVIDALRPK